MSQVINTNVASLNAQRNLMTSQSSLTTSLQRLSSGLRINSAKDDAAGLAISDRFTTQIRGLNQAVRNANDGISLSQVGESALAEVTSNLQRIRELAVQSANATNSASDRAALDLEVQQRLAEIDRIASQTAFNGRRILDGSFGNAAFQIGANVGETINVGLDTSMRRDAIGAVATAQSVDLSTLIRPASTGFVLGEGELTVTVDGSTAVEVEAGTYSTAADLAGAINTAAGRTIATVSNGELVISNNDDTNTIEFGGAAATTLGLTTVGVSTQAFVLGDGDLVIDGTAITGTFADVDALAAAITAANVPNLTATNNAGQLNLAAAGGDVVVSGNFATAVGVAGTIADGNNVDSTAIDDELQAVPTTETSTGVADALATEIPALTLQITELTIQLGDADPVTISGTFTTQQELVNEINRQLGGNASASITDNVLSFTSGEDITIGGADAATVFGDGDPAGAGGSGLSIQASGSLATVNVLTTEASDDAISRIDAALTTVSKLRSTFGALQNRFESTIANLQASSENLSASRSRILDADFAAETANLTRAQILQQAGVAMLAQANALPQNVLSLLR